MTLSAGIKGAIKKISASVAAVATAASLMVAGAGTAAAANRDWLRADATGNCDWDAHGYWVQRCDVWSASMGHNIAVQIQPAERGGNAGLYLLDGMRATDWANAWTVDTSAPSMFVGNNITLVMPVGGASSFYADWQGPAKMDGTGNYQWETFLTSELPAYLEANFGVARNNNSIAGLSMGGTAALNLAARHPDQFRQALSYSGYLTMSHPGMGPLLSLAMMDVGAFNFNNMYGGWITPTRFANDPYLNMDGLRNTDVYISAGNGLPAAADFQRYPANVVANGIPLEWFSRYTTTLWELKARASGINPTVNYPISGLHNWLQWEYQLRQSQGQILNVMNAW